ncbi:Uncharacterized protein dnm_093900 [Desulfonema magnum]|uniref:Uncharacterized protein n=1 Tax=Desulfonema magnum TaxID=45655 RepID=A0A975BWX9_9BACT|nr:Uncharacterized protein dnm_093900 [Desulfonema magnum]
MKTSEVSCHLRNILSEVPERRLRTARQFIVGGSVKSVIIRNNELTKKKGTNPARPSEASALAGPCHNRWDNLPDLHTSPFACVRFNAMVRRVH